MRGLCIQAGLAVASTQVSSSFHPRGRKIKPRPQSLDDITSLRPMGTFFRLLFTALLGMGGYALAKRWPRLARRCSQAVLIVTVVVLVTLAVSGIGHDQAAIGQLHRWLGHFVVIFVWLSVALLGGILLQRRNQLRAHRMMLGVVFLLFLLVAAVLGSVTGYLNVVGNDAVSEETHNRFVVLHFFVFPLFIAGLLGGVWRIVRRQSQE